MRKEVEEGERKKLIKVYELATMEYKGKFPNTIENIADFVASLTYDAKLVDEQTDTTILTTIGPFLDEVPNQKFRLALLPRLFAKQMSMETNSMTLLK